MGMEMITQEMWEYRGNMFAVIVSKDDGLWHISISHHKRYPTFDEIKEARYKFIPDDVTMAMFFPPRSQYVNVHPNCFHLFEVKDKFSI